VACLWSVVCFLLLVPFSLLSFRFIEAPFLKLRKRYIAVPSSNSPPPGR
jgi:peptidoglycan/LPS O-acetylase OafA/YrhL